MSRRRRSRRRRAETEGGRGRPLSVVIARSSPSASDHRLGSALRKRRIAPRARALFAMVGDTSANRHQPARRRQALSPDSRTARRDSACWRAAGGARRTGRVACLRAPDGAARRCPNESGALAGVIVHLRITMSPKPIADRGRRAPRSRFSIVREPPRRLCLQPEQMRLTPARRSARRR